MLDKFRDHLVEAQLLKDEKFTRLGFLIVGIVILLLLADIIYLNSIIFSFRPTLRNAPVSSSLDLPATPTIIFPTLSPVYDSPTPVPNLSVTAAEQKQEVQNVGGVKEYFIPLGSGTSYAGDWEDVTGVQANVDFSQYPNIKEVRFEASLSVPTANQSVSVRLFNQTDKHPVWFSEVSMNNNASAYLTSSPLAYDTGIKVYKVQMKTQLQSAANLVQSRIHITLK